MAVSGVSEDVKGVRGEEKIMVFAHNEVPGEEKTTILAHSEHANILTSKRAKKES